MLYYIVAGDEMQKLMALKFPDRKMIPFREDFSKGECVGFDFVAEMIEVMEKCIEVYLKHGVMSKLLQVILYALGIELGCYF